MHAASKCPPATASMPCAHADHFYFPGLVESPVPENKNVTFCSCALRLRLASVHVDALCYGRGEGNAGRRCGAEAGRRRACGTCLRRPQTPFTAACTHAPSLHVPHSCRAAARTPKTPAWNAEPRLEGLSSGGTRRYVTCPMRYRRGPQHACSLRAQCPVLCSQCQNCRLFSPGQASWYTVWNLSASNLEPLHTINAWRFSRASEDPVAIESPRCACQACPTAQLVHPVEPYRRSLELLHTINAWRFSRASAGPCHGRISTWRLSGCAAEAPNENVESSGMRAEHWDTT